MSQATSLHFSSITELAPRIQHREISPVEVVESTLTRIDSVDGILNSFLDVFRDEALAAARVREREIAEGRYRGPLHGVPVGLKDLIDVKDKVTTGGSTILADHVASRDATLVRRLEDAGAVVMGKLNLVEFALGAHGLNPHFGPAHNPWDLDRITCGSSSGSAASVAGGLLWGAIGSDTGGSIRMPAAVCGLAGLKPTYGWVSRAGVLDLSWSCDHLGPLTRTVADCALMMNALAGHDPADPASSREPVPDFTRNLSNGLDGLRIGVPEHYFFDDVDPEITAAVRAALDVMASNGATVRSLPMPWASRGRQINVGVMLPEAVSVHEQWLKTQRAQYSPEVRARLESAVTISALDYLRAQRARRWFIETMLDAMSDVDVLVTPTVPIQTPTIEACTPGPGEIMGREGANLGNFTGVFNTTGMPSLSIHAGFSASGMPIGMMISGKPFQDPVVLQVGHAYETISGGWGGRLPPIGTSKGS